MSQQVTSVVFGLSGPEVTREEKALFQDLNPWGYILYARNCLTDDQIIGLTTELKELSGREDLPILIDQEGGPVQRFVAPATDRYPSAADFGELFERSGQDAIRAVELSAYHMAAQLAALGITVNCMPVLDRRIFESGHVIARRAYHKEPRIVAELGRAAVRGLEAAGLQPVMKHIPGHGRASADSHLCLPYVGFPEEELDQTDFAPFRELSHLPMAMTAHVCFETLDAENTATQSAHVVHNVIRGSIGFDGLLLTDDISMQALSGPFASRVDRSLSAGCDVVVHGSGQLAEMKQAAKAVVELSGASRKRADNVSRLIAARIVSDVPPQPLAEVCGLFERNGMKPRIHHGGTIDE